MAVYDQVYAALELVDALWLPEDKQQAIHQSFVNDTMARVSFRALDRMVLRSLRILNNTTSTAEVDHEDRKMYLGRSDSTLLTVGTVVLRGENQQLVRSKSIQSRHQSNKNRGGGESLRDYILEQEVRQHIMDSRSRTTRGY